MQTAGLTVLVTSEEAGVHLAVGNGGSRLVFFQGHPEYDAISLLKEYKREVQRFHIGSRQTYPPYPEHYLDAEAKRLLDDYERRLTESDFAQQTLPPFPEETLADRCVNTWHAAGMQIFRNWLAGIDMSS
jgi:homoserine O-succinyltransferase